MDGDDVEESRCQEEDKIMEEKNAGNVGDTGWRKPWKRWSPDKEVNTEVGEDNEEVEVVTIG